MSEGNGENNAADVVNGEKSAVGEDSSKQGNRSLELIIIVSVIVVVIGVVIAVAAVFMKKSSQKKIRTEFRQERKINWNGK